MSRFMPLPWAGRDASVAEIRDESGAARPKTREVGAESPRSLPRTGAAGQEVRMVTAWRCWFAGRWWATISEGFSQGRTQAHDHGRMHSTEHDYERPDFAHCYVSLKH